MILRQRGTEFSCDLLHRFNNARASLQRDSAPVHGCPAGWRTGLPRVRGANRGAVAVFAAGDPRLFVARGFT